MLLSFFFFNLGRLLSSLLLLFSRRLSDFVMGAVFLFFFSLGVIFFVFFWLRLSSRQPRTGCSYPWRAPAADPTPWREVPW